MDIIEEYKKKFRFITEYKPENGGQLDEYILIESGINRLEDWTNKEEIATLNAWRNKLVNVTSNTYIDREIGNPDDQEDTVGKFSKKEKKERNNQLEAALQRYGYGVTDVKGSYIEGYSPKENKGKDVQEESFFVVNLHQDPNFKDNIFKLSEYYNQDSFIYKAPNSKAVLVGTNNSLFQGYATGVQLGDFIKNCAYQFLTRIGNKSFAFAHPDEVTDARPTSFNDRKYQRIYNHAYDKKYPNDKDHTGQFYNPYSLAKYTTEMFRRKLLRTYENLEINSKRICQIWGDMIINESSGKRMN